MPRAAVMGKSPVIPLGAETPALGDPEGLLAPQGPAGTSRTHWTLQDLLAPPGSADTLQDLLAPVQDLLTSSGPADTPRTRWILQDPLKPPGPADTLQDLLKPPGPAGTPSPCSRTQHSPRLPVPPCSSAVQTHLATAAAPRRTPGGCRPTWAGCSGGALLLWLCRG